MLQQFLISSFADFFNADGQTDTQTDATKTIPVHQRGLHSANNKSCRQTAHHPVSTFAVTSFCPANALSSAEFVEAVSAVLDYIWKQGQIVVVRELGLTLKSG